MESEHENEHAVRDIQFENMKILADCILSRQEVMITRLRTEIIDLKNDLKVLNVKIDGLEKNFDARIENIRNIIMLRNTRT